NSGYQQNFSKIGMQINDSYTLDDWKEVYKRLVYWELELADTDSEMTDMLKMQKTEANSGFAKFIIRNYLGWMKDADNRPLMSPDIFKKKIFPLLNNGDKVFLIVFDNFRYDQWRVISRELADDFVIDEELYTSILPTATQYARNAIFSGLMPDQIANMYSNLWVDEDEEEGKNLNEEPLIKTQLDRYRRKNTFSYFKLNNSNESEKVVEKFKSLMDNDLNVLVINFIDMLSHARTESRMVRELASDEKAYRSITASWFHNSPVRELFKLLAQTSAKVIITTDHGSIRVNNPIKVIGDKNTNTNLRYKLGKNLSYNQKQVYELKSPKEAFLPSPNLSTTYIFAKSDDFFAYPNNYNYYVSYYKNTFQHGGISMEEMLIPLVTLQSKRGK
ncbi:MAG: PglZ domain-containing protein, partial [Bacteroidaceae bacterium]|nr:PglZ domain-containing protein [Bacteroidaceae bacterium]